MTLVLTAALLPCLVHAHTLGAVETPADRHTTDLLILLAAALYALGALRLGRRGARRAQWLRSVSYFAGLAVLWLALRSVLDEWSAGLFAAHMVQHELLMLLAAPLIVLGQPLAVMLWGLPSGARAAVVSAVQARAWRGGWSAFSSPLSAWGLHALALWAWHAPAAFEAALLDRGLHDLQHLSFLGTALLFWSALLQARAHGQQGAAIVYLFTTMVHTSVLGALITFASHPWYAAYLNTTAHFGLTPLEDQQLGGLIMWVPGSLVYVALALVLIARWIGASESAARAQARSRGARALRSPASP